MRVHVEIVCFFCGVFRIRTGHEGSLRGRRKAMYVRCMRRLDILVGAGSCIEQLLFYVQCASKRNYRPEGWALRIDEMKIRDGRRGRVSEGDDGM